MNLVISVFYGISDGFAENNTFASVIFILFFSSGFARELEEKLEKTRKRLEKLLEKQKEMETKGLTQISLTDSDSKPANGSKPKRKYIKRTIVKIVFKPDYKK